MRRLIESIEWGAVSATIQRGAIDLALWLVAFTSIGGTLHACGMTP